MNKGYSNYLRHDKLPSVWCPGCGNGVIVKALLEAVDSLGLEKDDVVVIGGIGCSGRTPFILDFNTMHTTHGRALAFATGIKLIKPQLKVIVTMGDGDASAIGGNHFIHTCRRNLDITAIIFNNAIYGQTGGQLAPTTPQGMRSTTSAFGNIEPDFDLCWLAQGAGASFVARSTVFDFKELMAILQRALAHKGFSVVEVLTTCPTYFGRLNDMRDPYKMIHYLKDTTSPEDMLEHAKEELLDKMPTGIFCEETRAEYTELYRKLIERAQEGR
jgi:2-oxoglutarate ferredoxin oxidoreductase subunit beta